MQSALFNEKTIKKLCSSIKVTPKQRATARKWIELLESGVLEGERANYFKFAGYILEDILGYSIRKDLDHEKANIEFSFKNSKGETVLCIEVKGATKDLFKPQPGYKKELETPIKQTWNNMGRIESIKYGICTNYKDFILIDKSKGFNKYHFFDFLSIKDDEGKLKEFIAIFSKSSIIDKGFLETLYEESVIEEREFTKQFYKLFHETRLMLIKEFQDNGASREDAIHYAQIFLNRLMFVFFAEDTGKLERRIFEDMILDALKTSNLLSDQSRLISDAIISLFRRLDKGSKSPLVIFGFNGGLFKEEIPPTIYFKDFRKKEYFKDVYQYSALKKEVELDEHTQRILKKYKGNINPIILNLLYMASFDFNTEVSVNILGHIFEQSISDLEELKEEKTLRRKKEGIYYTPDYITDYICRNTIIPYLSKNGVNSVDKLIDEYKNNMRELEEKFKNLKILDPACGSGSFLIKAVEILLEIYKEIQIFKEMRGEYTAKASGYLKRKHKKAVEKGQLLTLSKWNEEEEARKIIENNIYGVDINEESVEITKLSLFLKIAKKNRKLIDLSKNIKCGNSLIDDPEVAGDKAFKWEEEFKEIMDNGGFDIVIGNPPWGAKLSDREKKYIKYQKFHDISLNTAFLFLEKSYSILKFDGKLGFILPKGLSYVPNLTNMRRFLIDNTLVEHIIDTSESFRESGVQLEAMIIIFSKFLREDKYVTTGYVLGNNFVINRIKRDMVLLENKFGIWLNEHNIGIIKKILDKSVTLGSISNSRRGIGINRYVSEKKDDFVILGGKNITRYGIPFLSYVSKEYIKDIFDWQKREKIILQEIAGRYGKPLFGNYRRVRLSATFDKKGYYTLDTVVNIFDISEKYSPKYILAILNSKLESWYFHIYSCAFSQLTLHTGNETTRSLPIYPADKDQQSLFIKKADLMLELNQKFYKMKRRFFSRIQQNLNLYRISKKLDKFYELEFKEFVQELFKKKIKLTLRQQDEWEDYFNKYKKEILELKEKIDRLDREIDEMVYKIYDLTDEEISIIEKSLG